MTGQCRECGDRKGSQRRACGNKGSEHIVWAGLEGWRFAQWRWQKQAVNDVHHTAACCDVWHLNGSLCSRILHGHTCTDPHLF